jgi:hypothetical protein
VRFYPLIQLFVWNEYRYPPVYLFVDIVVMSYRFTLGIHALEKYFMATCKHFLVLSISLWWVWRHDTYGNELFADPFCIFVFWLLHIWPLIQWGVEVLKSPFLEFLHSTVKGVCIVKGKEVFDSSKWFWSSKEYYYADISIPFTGHTSWNARLLRNWRYEAGIGMYL